MSISQACQELSFLVQLLKDIISINFEPVNINNDNQGAIALVKNPVKHQNQNISICIIILFVNTVNQIK